MENAMLQSASHMPQRPNISRTKVSASEKPMGKNVNMSNKIEVQDVTGNYALYNGLLFDTSNTTLLWNGNEFIYNTTNTTEMSYDYQMVNVSIDVSTESWSYCKEWTPTQHNLYQTANLMLAAAFIIPGSFKQSILLVRAILSLGYILLSSWAGSEVCSLDLFIWNVLLLLVNLGHTIMLTWRFLPPTLTIELTELYLKIFRPLRVSKKHFKELVREAQVVSLKKGDIYAVEDVSPADERLSILLEGKMRVTCDDTHLHFITTHQFLDSPEWEANHEQSDDVFQVTITAEEDCVYLCWPRMRLERVLRHRIMLKFVLDCIIGKDITQKLYSLNEHISGLNIERERTNRDEVLALTHTRSLSMDAVNTGTTGLVRSSYYKKSQQKVSVKNSSLMGSYGGLHNQCWIPVVAKQFPEVYPFIKMLPMENELTDTFDTTSATSLLKVPDGIETPQHTRAARKNREVKFQKLLK